VVEEVSEAVVEEVSEAVVEEVELVEVSASVVGEAAEVEEVQKAVSTIPEIDVKDGKIDKIKSKVSNLFGVFDFSSLRGIHLALIATFCISLFGSLSFVGLLQTSENTMVQMEFAAEDSQRKYSLLLEDYMVLYNKSSSLEGYYNELNEMYSALREEYSDLQSRYLDLEKEQNEYYEIINFDRILVMEENKRFELSAGSNITLVYDLLFAGYVEINFTSTTDVFFWIGSEISQEVYYSRYPPFPETASNGIIKMPACKTLNLNIKNPDLYSKAVVTLTIKFVY